MTTLEKAEHIMKNHNCTGFWCSCDGTYCPALRCNCKDRYGKLTDNAIKAAQAYIDANKPKENKLKTVKEFYQYIVDSYERGNPRCDMGSSPYEFKLCSKCPATHLCGNDSRARYEFCKAQLAKETEFKYGQVVYNKRGNLYTFLFKAEDGTMLGAKGIIIPPVTNTRACTCTLVVDTFYTEDPTKKEKTMTITDIEKALGYKIKVVGEK